MSKQKNPRRVLVLGQFAKQQPRIRPRQKQIRATDLLLRVAERPGKDLRRLHRPHVRTREQQIRRNPKLRHAARHLPRLGNPFLRQIALGLRRTFGILTIDRDSMTHHVNLHL